MSLQPTDPKAIAVVCHARASLALDPIDAKIRTLRRCAREDRVGAVDVRYWPGEVKLSEVGETNPIVDVYDDYREWADAAGVDIHPPFRLRESKRIVDDHATKLLVMPAFCLALYEEGRLVGVFPHQEGELQRSAAEPIAALRTGRVSELLSTLPAPEWEVDVTSPPATIGDRGVRSLRCPDCSGTLLNVQGILACSDCSWTAPWSDDRRSRFETIQSPSPRGRTPAAE